MHESSYIRILATYYAYLYVWVITCIRVQFGNNCIGNLAYYLHEGSSVIKSCHAIIPKIPCNCLLITFAKQLASHCSQHDHTDSLVAWPISGEVHCENLVVGISVALY